jgi:tripartite-type tricarboxylate transporter receptor subunit TctC
MVLATALASMAVQAQDAPFPSKPFTIVAPYSAGGTADALARVVANVVRTETQQPAIVDVKPGAAGTIGARQVARAKPDGYTLLLNSSGVNSVAPSLTPGYKPAELLAHVTVLTDVPFVMVVNDAFPARSMSEFIDHARRNPGRVRVGNASQGSHGHLTQVLFDKAAGIRMVPVPYKGSTPAITDLLGGHVDAVITNVEVLKPYIDSGRIRAMFITSKTRSAALPEVPTAIEQGLPFHSVAWFGVSVPKQTPAPVIAALNEILAKGFGDKAVRAKLIDSGMTPVLSSAAETSERLQSEAEQLSQVIDSLGLSTN